MQATGRDVYSFVRSSIENLATRSGDNRIRAVLAEARRGIGRKPGDMPELWGLLFEGMPEGMMSNGGEPSYAEWAVYTALTLFALHQQGRDIKTECMYNEKLPFGAAVRKLAKSDDDLERVRRRFNAIATASDMAEASNHLRGMVQLLRSEGVPFDYPALASDLFSYQFPDRASSVRLKWGQDFYRTSYIDKNDGAENADQGKNESEVK